MRKKRSDRAVGTRRRLFERLEPRYMLAANPFGTNQLQPLDVTRDGSVTALDALRVINALNRSGQSSADPENSPGSFIDVTGDGFGTALDALRVINALNINSPVIAGTLPFDSFPTDRPDLGFDLVTNDYSFLLHVSVGTLGDRAVNIRFDDSQLSDISDRFIDGTARLSQADIDALWGAPLQDGEYPVHVQIGDDGSQIDFVLEVDREAPLPFQEMPARFVEDFRSFNIKFNEEVLAADLTDASVEITEVDNPQAIDLILLPTGETLVSDFDVSLPRLIPADYQIQLNHSIQDRAGNSASDLQPAAFSVVAKTIQIEAITPASDSVGIALDQPIMVKLDAPISPELTNALSLSASVLTQIIPGDFSIVPEGNEIHFVPSESLPAGQTISVTLDGNLIVNQAGESVDADGDLLPGGSFTWQFKTEEREGNSPPFAGGEQYEVPQAGSITIDSQQGVLSNDSDPDGDPIIFTLVTEPSHGRLGTLSNGAFRYYPDDAYIGTDEFVYVVSDGMSTSQEVTTSLSVVGKNTAPTPVDDFYVVDPNGELEIDAIFGVLLNDVDGQSFELRAVLEETSEHGELTLQGDGAFRFVPDPGFEGKTTFRYSAADASLESNVIATVTIFVQPEGSARFDAETNSVSVVGTSVEDDIRLSGRNGELFVSLEVRSDTTTDFFDVTVIDERFTLSDVDRVVLSAGEGRDGVNAQRYQNQFGEARARFEGCASGSIPRFNFVGAGNIPVPLFAHLGPGEDNACGGPFDDAIYGGAGRQDIVTGGMGNDYLIPNHISELNSFGMASEPSSLISANLSGLDVLQILVPEDYSGCSNAVGCFNGNVLLQGAFPDVSNDFPPDIADVVSIFPEHGSLQLADGTSNSSLSFDYVPDANYFGQDRFAYLAVDRDGQTQTVPVLLNVVSINDAAEIAPIPDFVLQPNTQTEITVELEVEDVENDPITLSAEVIAPGYSVAPATVTIGDDLSLQITRTNLNADFKVRVAAQDEPSLQPTISDVAISGLYRDDEYEDRDTHREADSQESINPVATTQLTNLALLDLEDWYQVDFPLVGEDSTATLQFDAAFEPLKMELYQSSGSQIEFLASTATVFNLEDLVNVPSFVGSFFLRVVRQDEAASDETSINPNYSLTFDIKPFPEVSVKSRDGYLSIIGTDHRDRVTVESPESGVLKVTSETTINGVKSGEKIQTFNENTVSRIIFAGGAENDIFRNETSLDVRAWGGSGNDGLVGGTGDDQLEGGRGNDSIDGGFGDDTYIFSGSDLGEDSVYDLFGNGVGRDTLDFSRLATQVDVDLETPSVNSSSLTVNLFCYLIDDGEIDTGSALSCDPELGKVFENIIGSAFDDDLRGNGRSNSISGRAGNDTIYGRDGRDSLFGGVDNDTIYGGDGEDDIEGGDGDDVISGGADDDYIEGQGDNDTIRGGSGDDTIYGNSGLDFIHGGSGDDYIRGNSGNDELHGSAGDDDIRGQRGVDKIFAGSGDDIVWGEASPAFCARYRCDSSVYFERVIADEDADGVADVDPNDEDKLLKIDVLVFGELAFGGYITSKDLWQLNGETLPDERPGVRCPADSNGCSKVRNVVRLDQHEALLKRTDLFSQSKATNDYIDSGSGDDTVNGFATGDFTYDVDLGGSLYFDYQRDIFENHVDQYGLVMNRRSDGTFEGQGDAHFRTAVLLNSLAIHEDHHNTEKIVRSLYDTTFDSNEEPSRHPAATRNTLKEACGGVDCYSIDPLIPLLSGLYYAYDDGNSDVRTIAKSLLKRWVKVIEDNDGRLGPDDAREGEGERDMHIGDPNVMLPFMISDVVDSMGLKKFDATAFTILGLRSAFQSFSATISDAIYTELGKISYTFPLINYEVGLPQNFRRSVGNAVANLLVYNPLNPLSSFLAFQEISDEVRREANRLGPIFGPVVGTVFDWADDAVDAAVSLIGGLDVVQDFVHVSLQRQAHTALSLSGFLGKSEGDPEHLYTFQMLIFDEIHPTLSRLFLQTGSPVGLRSTLAAAMQRDRWATYDVLTHESFSRFGAVHYLRGWEGYNYDRVDILFKHPRQKQRDHIFEEIQWAEGLSHSEIATLEIFTESQQAQLDGVAGNDAQFLNALQDISGSTLSSVERIILNHYAVFEITTPGVDMMFLASLFDVKL